MDLTACESVSVEMHDHHSGVKYSLNGEEKWTPVKKRRCKKRISLMSRLQTAPLVTTHTVLVVAVLSLIYLVVDWSSTVSMMDSLIKVYTAETLFGLQLPLPNCFKD